MMANLNDRLGWLILTIIGAAILALAPLLGASDFQLSLMIEAMIFSILAMSLNFILGYAGLVSFGHAAFFAVGGYAAGLVANHVTSEIWVTLPAGLAVSALFALPIGWLSIRLSGFYFLMITLAFAQMVYAALFRWTWLTGGSDGLLFRGPTILNMPVLQSREQMYFFVLICFFATFALLSRIISGPFGQVLVGIRENTRRMRALGYDVRRYKLIAFCIASAFGGLAGVLNGQLNLFVSPESAHWTQSASILVMVLIGGAATKLGPVLGAVIVLMLQHWLSSYTEYWSIVLGILFIVLITVARAGVYGVISGAYARLAGGGR